MNVREREREIKVTRGWMATLYMAKHYVDTCMKFDACEDLVNLIASSSEITEFFS